MAQVVFAKLLFENVNDKHEALVTMRWIFPEDIAYWPVLVHIPRQKKIHVDLF
jgi:hypothetical protein